VVGGLCALLANFILIGLDRLGTNYTFSSVLAFLVTVFVAYALHTDWTFGGERSFTGLIRYAAAMAMNLPLSILLLFILIDLCGLRMLVAAPLATILQTAFNYWVAATLIRPRSAN
jgi:putative flippase GtrA